MRCCKCPNTSNHTGAKCWAKYNMCIKCAVIHHPEDYPISSTQLWKTRKLAEKERRILCNDCPDTILLKLRYNKSGAKVIHGLLICPKCKTIYNMNGVVKICQKDMKQ